MVTVLLLLFSFLLPNSSGGFQHLSGLDYYKSKIIGEYPHDPELFTEGLFFISDPQYGEILCESSGLYQKSKILKMDFYKGKVIQSHNLGEEYFGEGIAFWKNKIVQLTYKGGVGFVYDYRTLKPVGHFKFKTRSGEGWGLTTDGRNLIMSDGSDTLYFFTLDFTPDEIKFNLIKQLRVHYKGKSIFYLNELEYINGEIWACLYKPQGYIVRIDAHTGEAIAVIDLRDIFPERENGYPNGILNGIAWDENSGRIFVTGKWCPAIYEIKIYGVK